MTDILQRTTQGAMGAGGAQTDGAPAVPLPVFPRVIDSTMLTAYDACAQKFFNEFILGFGSKRKSIHLHAGGCLARGLEVARKAFFLDGLPQEQCIMRGLEAMMIFWGLDDYDDDRDYEVKGFEAIAGAYLSYFIEYPMGSDRVRPMMLADDKPAVEFTFAIPIPVNHPTTGEPLLFGGRFDMLGHFNQAGAMVDEKTTKSLGDGWSKQWAMRGQFYGYKWACDQHNIDVKYAIVRGIGMLKTQYKHAEAIVSFAPWQVDRWYEMMIRKVERMVEDFRTMDFDYSFGDACSSYSGCQFLPLCTSADPSKWYSDYGIRRWDPTKKDPTS